MDSVGAREHGSAAAQVQAHSSLRILMPVICQSAYLLHHRRVKTAQLRLRSQQREIAQAGDRMTRKPCT